MDPNAALENLRECARTIIKDGGDPENDSVEEYDEREPLAELAQGMADSFEALDEWLVKGGFLPAAWQATRNERPCELCGGTVLAEHRTGCKASNT